MGIIKKFRIKSFKNIKSVIELKDISLSFKNRLILDRINFKINKGQILGLLGPNGVGKSTVFNIITGLLKPTHGKILMDGEDITNYPIAERATKFNIGYVPQYGGYFHDLTLEENLYAIAEIIIPEKNSVKINETVVKNGVKVIGTTIAPESVSTNASELFAKNIFNFINHLTEDNSFKWDLEEEITDETLIVKDGEIRKK